MDVGIESRAGRLVAVVVTHNRLSQIKVTVERLLATPPWLLEALVVVDSASNDGTSDWLAEQVDPRLLVLSSDRNIGGAGGFEWGMREAVSRFDPDWLAIMDDDGRPEHGALEAFHGSDVTSWDAVAAAVYYPDGRICEMNRPSRNPFTHLGVFLRALLSIGARSSFHIPPAAYYGEPIHIDITSFVGLFVSRRAVEMVGYPNGQLFVYGEDGLYTLELSQAGGRIGFLPEIRFEHDCKSIGTDKRFRPLWKIYYYHRNLLMLYRLAAGPMFWPAMTIVLPKWILKARHYKGNRWRYLRLLQMAVSDGLRGRAECTLNTVKARAGEE